MKFVKINPVAIGITLGVLLGLSLFSLGMLTHTLVSGVPIYVAIGSLYLTYNTSFLSALVFCGMGLISGFVVGYIFASLYNLLSERV